MLHHARGMLRFGEGRFDASAGGVRARAGPGTAARQRRTCSRSTYAAGLSRYGCGWATRTAAHIALAGLSQEQRNRAGVRIALAALALEQDNPEHAVEALAPVIDGSAPALYERWARVEALLLDATARDRLGDRRGAEESLEAALELAEPEGLVLPFMLWPSRELLERHPKHRTAHATLIATILDTLAGRGTRSARTGGALAR